MLKHIVKIKNGKLFWLGVMPFDMPKKRRKVRFSEIVPDPRTHPFKFCAFKVLRFVFGEHGRVSTWTRAWSCLWEARVLIGPQRGRSMRNRDRTFLIEWEQGVWKNEYRYVATSYETKALPLEPREPTAP